MAAVSVETALMPGKLVAGHAKLEDDCERCHQRFDKSAQTRLCLDCHKQVAADVAQRRGYHGRIQEGECRVCHTEHKGRKARISPLLSKTFDHGSTDFVLRDAHASKAECRDCHRPGKKFRQALAACVSCHRSDDKHKGSLGKACADCHGEKNWQETRFDHAKTDFPLSGKHVELKCTDCHRDQRFTDAPKACAGCHKLDDAHKGRFGQKCESCHTDRSWQEIGFDHERRTKYPLRGQHRQATCVACHKGWLYKEKLRVACVACHKPDDAHKGSLGTKCESCHGEQDWKTSSFNHDRETKFSLRDKHKSAKCESCHKGPFGKEKLPLTCYACHKADDTHKGRYGEKCASCHNEKRWKESGFRHDVDTRYVLRGKHVPVKCDACHKGFIYKEKLAARCDACHQKDDKHKHRYGDKCESCHAESNWKDIAFQHDRDTKYALRGKHMQTRCDSCHTGHLYKDKLKTACISCHDKDDKHKGQQGKRCEQCHNEQSWNKAKFDHGLARFPLLGKHIGLECKKCHASAAFKDAKSDCVACHDLKDPHKRQLGPQCELCHNARDWKLWDYDHDRRSKFVLDGAHKGLDCLACHKRPVGKQFNASSACNACHQADDVHEGGFGQDCQRCHDTQSFKNVRRDMGKPIR